MTGLVMLFTLIGALASDKATRAPLGVRVWHDARGTWLTTSDSALDRLFGPDGLDAVYSVEQGAWLLSRQVDVDELKRFFSAHAQAVTVHQLEVPLPPARPARRQLERAPEGIIIFASGTNTVGEVRGVVEAGHPVGAAAGRCHGPCMQELGRLGGTGIPVFLDSGAFEEMNFEVSPPAVKKLMTPQIWETVFTKYEYLAPRLGAQLYAVAPDRVGDQQVTLERLAHYRDRVLALGRQGVNVLVAMQGGGPGELSLPAFHDAVNLVLRDPTGELGDDWWLPAVPMASAATSVPEIRDYLSARPGDAIHYLGLGWLNDLRSEVIAVTEELAPGAQISMDSMRWAAIRGYLAHRRPRILTAQQAFHEQALLEHRWGSPPGEYTLGYESSTGPILDYTEFMGDPGGHMSRADIRKIGKAVGLEGREVGVWADDPAAYWSDHPELRAELDEALDAWWMKNYTRRTKPEVKRRAVRDVFRDEPGATLPPAELGETFPADEAP